MRSISLIHRDLGSLQNKKLCHTHGREHNLLVAPSAALFTKVVAVTLTLNKHGLSNGWL